MKTNTTITTPTNTTTNSTVKTNTTTNSTVKTNTTTTNSYGSTCLGTNDLCAYNYACKSTCCSSFNNRCKTLLSSQRNTMTSLCSVSPNWYPAQPGCSISSSNVISGSSTTKYKVKLKVSSGSKFYGIVIGIPCLCCSVCIALIFFCIKQRKKQTTHVAQTQVVHLEHN